MSGTSLSYAGTSGWSGSATSYERAVHADRDGTTSRRQSLVLMLLARTGEAGITYRELGAWFGWHHGQSSGVLSVLHKEQRISRLTERRGRCAIYVLNDDVLGRETVTQGRHRACPHCGGEL